MHEESHSPMCAAIERFTSFRPEWNTLCYNLEEWTKFRKALMTLIRLEIRRDLKSYEVEMLMCAKACLICKRQIDLRTCIVCYSSNYCRDHELAFTMLHKPRCEGLLLLLNINVATMYSNICTSYPAFLKFARFPDKADSFHDMRAFVNGYIVPRSNRKNLTSKWRLNYYVYSEYVSGPLTLHHAFEELSSLCLLQIDHKCVVHLVAPDVVDIEGAPAWELLLHLLNVISRLYVVMIRPDIDLISGERNNLCRKCSARGRKLYVENVSESYQDYVSSASYKQPNVIVGFQVEFNDKVTWLKSLSAILAQKCPLILTTNSENQSMEIVDKVSAAAGVTRKLFLFIKNKFQGCRPYRDYETGGVFYRNSNLIIF
ncbi:hypothetical protein EAI_16099 [Harpegnathos saltator]|uniref:Mitochondrial splicing suppressor 51-like C-terminal domain-containing protein n=2 Tax=Harpegnathos saltator TaxID=610380 RepID=E2B2I8_HARSA|nr:hypothetical protein EAI_16099 [Harpegnathos saltator]